MLIFVFSRNIKIVDKYDLCIIYIKKKVINLYIFEILFIECNVVILIENNCIL